MKNNLLFLYINYKYFNINFNEFFNLNSNNKNNIKIKDQKKIKKHIIKNKILNIFPNNNHLIYFKK